MRLLLLFILALTAQISAQELAAPANARQLVVVATEKWSDTSGTLRCFSRSKPRGPWLAVGPAIAVKVGSAGMAWGLGLHKNPPNGPLKIEGDKKTPAGVFRLTSAFGYDTKPAGVSLPYIHLLSSVEGVDDPKSRYYNRIVDRTRIAKPDWNSSEKMRLSTEEYRHGIFVAHNPHSISGRGSCIFLHVWKNPDHSTTGCTAMPRGSIAKLQCWLRPDASPVLMQAPRAFLPPSLRLREAAVFAKTLAERRALPSMSRA